MEKLLSKFEVSEFLNISQNTLDRIVRDGLLPVYRIRGQCRFMQADVDAYLSSCRELHNVMDIQTAKSARKPERIAAVPQYYIPGMKVV